jgi:hypothetical protein
MTDRTLPPLAWLKARLARDESSPTGFVWKERPKGDFKTEGDWRSWNATNAGRRAGSLRKSGRGDAPYVLIKSLGKPVYLDVRALDIAFKTGTWPTGRLPPWTPSPIPVRQGAMERLSASDEHIGEGPLASFFASQCEESGHSPDDLTVLSRERDPFRLDIPTKRRDAEWFADKFRRHFADREEAHLREIHYVLATAVPPIRRPDGHPYRNTHKDWRWLLNKPAKAARWLGLVPWNRISDNRSEDPVIHRQEPSGGAEASLLTELDVPDEIDVTPTPTLDGFEADQPFSLALFSEKSPMAEDLATLAERYHGNAYVGGGDQVDRRIWEIARDADDDGRKLVIFTVCDCDPGGWNMPIAIARKLQALAVSEFPGLEFEVVRAGLTPDQVRILDLPSSPLKPTEARADRWREMMGVEQTEIDAALALKHDALIATVEQAIRPYFDETLRERVEEAQQEWQAQTEAAIEEQIDAEEIASLQARYDAAREEIERVNYRLRVMADAITLPAPPPPPEPDMDDKINCARR